MGKKKAAKTKLQAKEFIKFEGSIVDDHPTIEVILEVIGGDGKPFFFKGILDTASRQTVVKVGTMPDELFSGSGSNFGSGGQSYKSGFRKMYVTLRQGETSATLQIPVYQMPLGFSEKGENLMLVGRTVLDQCTFVYDGVKKNWTLTFPVAE